jgi:hypothetical protein
MLGLSCFIPSLRLSDMPRQLLVSWPMCKYVGGDTDGGMHTVAAVPASLTSATCIVHANNI